MRRKLEWRFRKKILAGDPVWQKECGCKMLDGQVARYCEVHLKELQKSPICGQCHEEITEGEDVFFESGEKFCTNCAEDNGNVCECGGYKKDEFKECYDCSRT